LFALLGVSPVLQGCTDLSETPSSAITPDNFYRNEQEIIAGLAAVYAELRAFGSLWAYYNLSEITTDEMIVPTRGSDWFDNGRWLEIHRHTWSPNSPSVLDDMNGSWSSAYRGISRANVVLSALPGVTVANKAAVEAELRTLRAFYYYMLLDLFGGVPIATTTEIVARERATRAELFQFIEDELLESRAALPLTWPAANNGRMTQGAADAILASLYLNAGVFTKDDGILPTAYNSCQQVNVGGGTACQAAVAHADNILNSGAYSLATNWHANFRHDNHLSPENILVVKHLNQPDLGMNFLQRALHYNQISPDAWNGFATLSETYNAFDADDQRREIFLIGQQYDLDELSRGNTVPVTDRQGNPLVFVDSIPNAEAAGEHHGVRIMKWPPDPNHLAEHHSNDFAYFRLAEILLIKAEALNEITPGDATALLLLNQVRARVFEPDKPLVGPVTRDIILNERLFELTAEAKRRQDLIRHGKYLNRWSTVMLNGKTDKTGEPYRVLMPIPQTQLDANPLLCQNPGYGGPVC
jgi:hypothetical protein